MKSEDNKNYESLVFIQNGKSVTSSEKIAEKFEKRHGDVLRAIENLECSKEFFERNFASSLKIRELQNGGRKEEKQYIITRDGFTFLAMGFTGKKAAQFKEDFIEDYNKKDEALKKNQQPKTKEEKWLDSIKELYETVQEQRKQLEVQKPKVDYVDQVLESDKTYTTTTIAKELGMGAKTLNKRLFRMGVQYFHDGHWVLYHKYQNRGYTKTKTHTYEGPNGEQKTSITTVWTERGRAFIHWKMKDEVNDSQLKIN